MKSPNAGITIFLSLCSEGLRELAIQTRSETPTHQSSLAQSTLPLWIRALPSQESLEPVKRAHIAKLAAMNVQESPAALVPQFVVSVTTCKPIFKVEES